MKHLPIKFFSLICMIVSVAHSLPMCMCKEDLLAKMEEAFCDTNMKVVIGLMGSFTYLTVLQTDEDYYGWMGDDVDLEQKIKDIEAISYAKGAIEHAGVNGSLHIEAATVNSYSEDLDDGVGFQEILIGLQELDNLGCNRSATIVTLPMSCDVGSNITKTDTAELEKRFFWSRNIKVVGSRMKRTNDYSLVTSNMNCNWCETLNGAIFRSIEIWNHEPFEIDAYYWPHHRCRRTTCGGKKKSPTKFVSVAAYERRYFPNTAVGSMWLQCNSWNLIPNLFISNAPGMRYETIMDLGFLNVIDDDCFDDDLDENFW